MMLAGSSGPYGGLCVQGQPVKLRGAVLLQTTGEWPGWCNFWATWDWPRIVRIIDKLAALGVNCVQVTATGKQDWSGGAAHPSDATMLARITQLAQYTASKGMLLNPQVGYQPRHTFSTASAITYGSAVTYDGADVANGCARAATMAALFAQQANIAFIDCMNEYLLAGTLCPGWSTIANGGTAVDAAAANAKIQSDMGALAAAVRAVAGGIPITISTNTISANVNDAALAPFIDFHNFHTYPLNLASGSGYAAMNTGNAPAVLANLKAQAWYLGSYLVGETGLSTSGASTLLEVDAVDWINGVNGQYGADPECKGIIWWGANDTSGNGVGQAFGLYDYDGNDVAANSRTALRTAAIQSWPARIGA